MMCRRCWPTGPDRPCFLEFAEQRPAVHAARRAGLRVGDGRRRHGAVHRERTGPGIAPQYRDRIFERFYRVPGQNKTTGAGLGLAIAKEIVEAHDGTIHLETQEGKGSKFSFTLMQAGKKDAAATQHNNKESASQALAATST